MTLNLAIMIVTCVATIVSTVIAVLSYLQNRKD